MNDAIEHVIQLCIYQALKHHPPPPLRCRRWPRNRPQLLRPEQGPRTAPQPPRRIVAPTVALASVDRAPVGIGPAILERVEQETRPGKGGAVDRDTLIDPRYLVVRKVPF